MEILGSVLKMGKGNIFKLWLKWCLVMGLLFVSIVLIIRVFKGLFLWGINFFFFDIGCGVGFRWVDWNGRGLRVDWLEVRRDKMFRFVWVGDEWVIVWEVVWVCFKWERWGNCMVRGIFWCFYWCYMVYIIWGLFVFLIFFGFCFFVWLVLLVFVLCCCCLVSFFLCNIG